MPISPAKQLGRLLQDVAEARAALTRDRRRPGSTAGSSDAARAQLLDALSAYTAALEDRRLPVPYTLRDELRIGRSVSNGLPGHRHIV